MSTPHIIKYFAYEHLPAHLQTVSKPIGDMAREFDQSLPDCAEKSAGLRKLLEAKDCLVRAALEVKAEVPPEPVTNKPWICPSCCMGFADFPEMCPHDAPGCNELLAEGK